MHSASVKLPSSRGTTMAGTIDFPDTPPRAFAVFAHCFAGSRFTPAASRVGKKLTEFGIATLRFDFPGLGQSEGDFGDTTFSQNVDDVVAAYSWMVENYAAPQLLIGHSLGGAATLRAGGLLPKAKAVATIGAPFDPAHSVLHYADRIKEVDEHGAVTVVLGGRELTISREFLEDLAETNPETYLPRLRKPLLLVHSPVDQTVGVDNAQKIFQLTRYPKSLVTLDKADHLLTKEGAAQRAAELIGTWVTPLLVDASAPITAAPGTVTTRTAAGSKAADTVYFPTTQLTTDQPKSNGGKNLGPAPLELVAAALAASSSQAIRAAAAAARMPLIDVAVTVTHATADDNRPVFTRRIEVVGNFSDEAIATLKAAGRGTPTDRLLAAGTIRDVD